MALWGDCLDGVVPEEVGTDSGSDAIEILNNAVSTGDLNALKQLARVNGPDNLRNYLPPSLLLSVCHMQKQAFDFVLDHPELDVQTNSIGSFLLLELVTCYKRSRYNPLYAYFMQRLLQNGVDVNAKDEAGWNALQKACHYRYAELINFLLCYGADVKILSEVGLLSFENAIKCCSDFTLKFLFRNAINGLETVELPLSVLIILIKMGRLEFLRTTVLQLTTSVKIPEYPNDIAAQVDALFTLPFKIFEPIAQKFSNIVDNIRKVCVTKLMYSNRDAIQYVEFMCEHCKNLERFNGTILFEFPEKVSIEQLEKLFFMLVSHDVTLELDLNYMYSMYGFSSQFENLLHMKIQEDEETQLPFFVPVWCNTRMTNKLHCMPYLMDKKKYFARTGQVSSLVQLSRDATRKHLNESYDIENYAQLTALMEKLFIYGIIKDILTYKRPIYY